MNTETTFDTEKKTNKKSAPKVAEAADARPNEAQPMPEKIVFVPGFNWGWDSGETLTVSGENSSRCKNFTMTDHYVQFVFARRWHRIGMDKVLRISWAE